MSHWLKDGARLHPSSEWSQSQKLFTLQCSNEIAHRLLRCYYRWILPNAIMTGEFIGSSYSWTLSGLFDKLYCISTRCVGINPHNVLGLFRTNDLLVEAAAIYVWCISNGPFSPRLLRGSEIISLHFDSKRRAAGVHAEFTFRKVGDCDGFAVEEHQRTSANKHAAKRGGAGLSPTKWKPCCVKLLPGRIDLSLTCFSFCFPPLTVDPKRSPWFVAALTSPRCICTNRGEMFP